MRRVPVWTASRDQVQKGASDKNSRTVRPVLSHTSLNLFIIRTRCTTKLKTKIHQSWKLHPWGGLSCTEGNKAKLIWACVTSYWLGIYYDSHTKYKLSHFKSTIIEAGTSKKDFQRLENLATVAPSITLWSADQLTCMMWLFLRLPSSPNLGSTWNIVTEGIRLAVAIHKLIKNMAVACYVDATPSGNALNFTSRAISTRDFLSKQGV